MFFCDSLLKLPTAANLANLDYTHVDIAHSFQIKQRATTATASDNGQLTVSASHSAMINCPREVPVYVVPLITIVSDISHDRRTTPTINDDERTHDHDGR